MRLFAARQLLATRIQIRQLTSVRNISSSVQGALNSLGRAVISSGSLVYSKGATSNISAVSGSILFISSRLLKGWAYLNILKFLNLHESPPTFPTHCVHLPQPLYRGRKHGPYCLSRVLPVNSLRSWTSFNFLMPRS